MRLPKAAKGVKKCFTQLLEKKTEERKKYLVMPNVGRYKVKHHVINSGFTKIMVSTVAMSSG